MLGDGSSDQVLLSHITWISRQHLPSSVPIAATWADLTRLRKRPTNLVERISGALAIFPCDLLCVHRDAERESPEVRFREIESAISKVRESPANIRVVPVRMTEAWLMFDEGAIRSAAGNPHGHAKLELPPIGQAEELADPKRRLHDILRAASELEGRRLRNFKVGLAVRRIVDFCDDLSPLRQLDAFRRLEADLREYLQSGGWLGEISAKPANST